MVVPVALRALRLRPRTKFCVLGELAKETGWKRKEFIENFEKKRKIRAVGWYKKKKVAMRRERLARNDPSVKNSEHNNILASYGY